METAHKAANFETRHMLNCNKKELHTKQDKLAYFASIGRGFAPRNIVARVVGGMVKDAYIGNNHEEQQQLDIHKTNLEINQFNDFGDRIHS